MNHREHDFFVLFVAFVVQQACLAFHETRRPVHTASFAQVRLPIYRDSVGRWRNYADALAPLFARLDELPS